MRYQQPWGIADEDAPYINGDPSIGRMGSIPPAAAFEQPMRELVAVINDSFMVPLNDDLEQVAKAIRSQRMNYAEDTGSVDTLSVAFDPPIEVYTIGLPIRVKVRNTNTGPATIDAGGGRVAIKKPSGAQLGPNDIRAAGLAELVYDGTAFQLINFGGAGGTGGIENTYLVNIPYTVDTSPTPNIIVADFSPAITSIGPGTIVMVKAVNTNTGLTTININGLGSRPISAIGGIPQVAFLPGDSAAGDVMILTYDGTNFWVVPNPALPMNCTFNVVNNTDIDNIFRALSRKRILPTVTVTVKLATGIYGPFSTYHGDANRIVVEGTMIAASPNAASFARTGSSAAARASDAANNIVMLRSRYGTEIRYTNAFAATGVATISHYGPGRITFKNLLVSGQNTYLYPSNSAIAAQQCNIEGCSIWGAPFYGIAAVGSQSIRVNNTYLSSCWGPGIASGTSSAIFMDNSGVFGGGYDGFYSASNGAIYLYTGVYSQCNALRGFAAEYGGIITIGTCVSTSNGTWDEWAYGNACLMTHTSAVIGTASPPIGQVGNYNSSNLQTT